jgi:hypothetical protein
MYELHYISIRTYFRLSSNDLVMLCRGRQQIMRSLQENGGLTKRAQMKGEVKGADELRIRWLHCCARE